MEIVGRVLSFLDNIYYGLDKQIFYDCNLETEAIFLLENRLERYTLRYPKPLNEKEWAYLMKKLDEPLTAEQKMNIEEMVKIGSKIKVYSD